MKKRGQTSVELIVILGVVLTVFIVIFVSSNFAVTSFQRSNDEKMSRVALEQIAASAKRVYAQGEGATDYIFVRFPKSINNTVVNNDRIEIHLVGINGTIQRVQRAMSYEINGTMPTMSGLFELKLQSRGSYVQIE